jgi:hypothetical protein
LSNALGEDYNPEAKFSALSSDSKYILVDGGHAIHLDFPDMIEEDVVKMITNNRAKE